MLTMLHNLTIGHLDTDAIERERRVRMLRPLEMEPVNRLLAELGGKDGEGRPMLDKGKVEIKDGYIICPWRIGGYRNRVAEQFATRLQEETGCVLADREHSRIVDAAQFAESEAAAVK
jgi:hypothetical protein